MMSNAVLSLNDWIARDAVPFSIESPDALHGAIDRIARTLLGSVELLGFGEALHGGEEILILRNRLFERLVTAHGYTAIALESSFPRGWHLNEYVNGRGTASYDEMQEIGFSLGFGKLEANRELIEWMRQYNADPARTTKLSVYGFDQPGVTAGPASPRQGLDFALDYLASLDKTAADTLRTRIDPLLGEDARWESPMAWRDPATAPALLSATATLRGETEDLIAALETRRVEWIAATDEARYLEALQYAKGVRHLLTFYVALARGTDYAASLGVRDLTMADYLAYIAAHEKPRGKTFVFAHNKHLQRGQAHWQFGPTAIRWWPAGAHVAQQFGDRYAVIGTAVGSSADNGIAAPEADTLVACLIKTPGPVRFVPTRDVRDMPLAGMPVRTGSKKNPTYFGLDTESLADFDGLITLDSITCTRGGRPI